jgi:putative phosphoesterase
MDRAVLSDIHSNYIALETCINYALSKNIKTFIFLGDYVGDLAYPEKTMQRIYELSVKYDCYFIKGNKEDYWIDYQNGGLDWRDNDSTTGSLLYTYNHLTEKDIDFFKGIPISQNITIDNMPSFTICHGSPYKVNHKLLPDNNKTLEIMDSIDTSIILCGHTHIQSKIESKVKMVLNPGSVGVPLHSNCKSQFLILHNVNNKWKEEFISLDYDIEKIIDDLHSSGLDKNAPYWSIITEHLLRNGNISHATVLSKAMSLCRDETGNCIWPNIPEKYWKQAVEDILYT